MTLSSGYETNEAIFLMTLSGYAYIDRTAMPGEGVTQQQARMRQDIDGALSASAYKDWRVSWGPGLSDDRSNMMYVAEHQTTHQCAVVIRGTDPSFWLDWVQDFGAVLGLVRFPYTTGSTSGTVQIATGTSIGLNALVPITGLTPSGAQQDLVTYLKSVDASADIFVTGHSLGGCLASVLALFLVNRLGNAKSMKVYTFAAPSAGNAAFAAYYNQTFADASGASRAFRVYNTLDVIPNAWASLGAVEALYVPQPRCTDELRLLIELTKAFVGSNYVQVGTPANQSAYPLQGQVIAVPPTLVPLDPQVDALFADELGLQHATSLYLKLLGATPTPPIVAKLRGMALTQQAGDGAPAPAPSPAAPTG